jgi:hypothetical protein
MMVHMFMSCSYDAQMQGKHQGCYNTPCKLLDILDICWSLHVEDSLHLLWVRVYAITTDDIA